MNPIRARVRKVVSFVADMLILADASEFIIRVFAEWLFISHLRRLPRPVVPAA
jgi:hypothetical protein